MLLRKSPPPQGEKEKEREERGKREREREREREKERGALRAIESSPRARKPDVSDDATSRSCITGVTEAA